jgi:putative colanic acid biosynthesis UDP-glucose lipid carrier transferase
MLNNSTAVWFQRALDPIMTIVVLGLLSLYYQVEFDTAYVLLGAIAFLLIIPIFKTVGLYHSFRGRYLGADAPRLFFGWFIVAGLLLGFGYGTQTLSFFPYPLLWSWLIFTPLVLSATHLLMRLGLRQLRKKGYNMRVAVIVGHNELGHCLAHELHHSPHLGIKLAGFFDNEPSELNQQGHPLLGKMEGVIDYVHRHKTDIVYIATQVGEEDKIGSIVQKLQDTTASVYFVPSIFVFSLMKGQMHEINGIPLVAGWDAPFAGLEVMLKRLVDVILASTILVLISPILLAIALGVKLSSPGPILFKQRRYGINGQEITVYKFRSMTVTEDGDKVTQAKRNDKRITKFGAFLRRTSLDELPQFINVLQGRMSIVGPRPHAIAHNEEYRKLISGYMLRHKVKPGITGWAQVNGYRGETDTLDKMQKRIEYDLQYIREWSLLLDLQIIFKTAFVVFNHKNAY